MKQNVQNPNGIFSDLISQLKEKLRVKNRATKCWKVRVRMKQMLCVDGLED
jgi:hypothetical protein